ncbi:two-component system, OmpR family, phosphate regulon sensor histidine kinase PhoR [Chryseobacterium oleae]|uniref:histidine kinase n=1 Tax=Chryseobacterium oleae TaxID=491207 RepID=A0A1I4ZP20_CHROL|nr:HAMP domain-containing sensor histidine kinase [Chryseobacterium oleae]SFN52015.1 two-component system, OmpR family, phosphate regulon sensor histidine kinase PhoR [Chryseobacterium oleae]
MITKSKNLIALFAALFLLLLGIQAYFMYKTYQVKEREIYRDVHAGLTNYTDRLEDLGGIKSRTDDTIQKILIRYHDKKISKKDFLEYFKKNRKENEKHLSDYVDTSFKKEGYKIATKTEYISIIYIPDSTRLIDQPITLYETRNKVSNPKISNTGKWETTSRSTTNDDTPGRNDSFILKSNTGFEILNIKTIIFKELALLTICCAAILASVLLLYIFTVKNLARQQKQVEVLHTVVDNISHEFKTPIATLKIASKTLKKEWNPETLPLIDRQINRLENLMLQLHKDENSEETLSIQPEDWNFFVEDLAFTYPQTSFDLSNKVTEELPFDHHLMETLIKNLCENSVKYGASDVKINISNSLQTLKIEISDNGCGIEKKELAHIFEKFYRIQANNIHNTKGLGLGLYFVKKIVTKYGGNIEVSSLPKTETTFKISVPYEN